MASLSLTQRNPSSSRRPMGLMDRLESAHALARVDSTPPGWLPSRTMSIPFLGVVRRSRHVGGVEDESVSVPYQKQVCREVAARHGGHIHAWAIDLNISAGTVICFDRPELGPWMADRVHEYQGIITLRGDRILRKTQDLHPLCEWAVDERKIVIFAKGPADSGEMVLDFRRGPLDPITNIILTLNTFYSELEWWTKKERNKETAAWLASVGRWAGGPIPYQLEPVKAEKGWTLGLNLDTEDITRGMIDSVFAGKSLSSIARSLNDRGVLTPLDYQLDQKDKLPIAKISGVITLDGDSATIEPEDKVDRPQSLVRPKKGGKWSVKSGDRVEAGQRLTTPGQWNQSTISVILRSRSLVGQRTFNGKLVLDDNGTPVSRCEALLDLETFHKLQDELNKSSRKSKGFKTNVLALATQFAFCSHCGNPIYHRNNGGNRYYRCMDAWGYNKTTNDAERCFARSMRAEVVENLISNLFLEVIGDLDVIKYERLRPNDNREQLRESKEALQQVLRERNEKPPALWDVYDDTISTLEGRILKLAEETQLDVKIIETRTGETYRDLWFGSEIDERRELLRSSGVRLEITPASGEGISLGRFERPAELYEAVQVGAEDGISYAMFLSGDIAERVSGRDRPLVYDDTKLPFATV